MSSERIDVQQGEVFKVVLREPAATGHRWRLTEATAAVALIDERYDAPAPGSARGSAGQRIFTLRAVARGHHRLKLALARLWETQPAAEHHVDVYVR